MLCLWHCRLSLHVPHCSREFRVLPSLHQSVKELPQSYGLRSLEPLLHSLFYNYFYLKNYVGIVLRVKKFYSDYDEKSSSPSPLIPAPQKQVLLTITPVIANLALHFLNDKTLLLYPVFSLKLDIFN